MPRKQGFAFVETTTGGDQILPLEVATAINLREVSINLRMNLQKASV